MTAYKSEYTESGSIGKIKNATFGNTKKLTIRLGKYRLFLVLR